MASHTMQKFKCASIHFNVTSRSAQQPQNNAQYGFVVLLFREGFFLLGYTARLLKLFLTYCTSLSHACPLLIFLTIR